MFLASPSRFHAIWLLLAAGFAAGALILSPARVAVWIPERAAHLRTWLLEGIAMERYLFAAGCFLALVSYWLFRRLAAERRDTDATGRVAFSKLDLVVVAAIFLLAGILRAINMNQTLWWDELATVVRVVKRGLGVILAFSAEGNNHPLNSLLVFFSTRVFGDREWSIRLFSVLLGTATPCILYLLLLRHVSRLTALAGALLFALHFRSVMHSAEARGYAAAMFFGAVSCLLFPLLFREMRTWVAAAYVLATALSVYSIATFIYVPAWHGLVAGLCVLYGWRQGRPAPALRVLLVTCWAMLGSLLLIGLLLPQLVGYARSGAELAHDLMSIRLLQGILQYSAGVKDLTLAGFAAVASAAGWIFLARRSWLLLAAVLGPGLFHMLAFTLQGVRGSPRLFVALILPFMIGLAACLAALWNHRTRGRALALILVAGFLAGEWPLFRDFYLLGTAPLCDLAKRIPSEDLLLAGAQSDMNTYYFPKAQWTTTDQTVDTLRQMRQLPKYVLTGVDCQRGGLREVSQFGYEVKERLTDWTAYELFPWQRQPCFVLYSR